MNPQADVAKPKPFALRVSTALLEIGQRAATVHRKSKNKAA